jgi:GDP-4-dehydro-6-deoxy-D-mannose reductase
MVHPDEVPIKETNPLRPLSPYAVSKVTQDYLGYQYWMSWKLDSVRTRGFNHEGPRRGPVFVASDFAKQIADIEKGRRDAVLSVGNLEARRDFTDVRDMVRAYWLALEKCEPGEAYNICSGKAWSIQQVLDLLLGMTKAKIEVKQDPARLRPSDVPVLLGDNSKFVKATGWKPTIPFEQTLRDMLDFWRSR